MAFISRSSPIWRGLALIQIILVVLAHRDMVAYRRDGTAAPKRPDGGRLATWSQEPGDSYTGGPNAIARASKRTGERRNTIDIQLGNATNIARGISLLQRAAPAHMQVHDIQCA